MGKKIWLVAELGSFVALFAWSAVSFWYIWDELAIYYMFWNMAIFVNGVACVWLLVHMRTFRRGIWKSKKQGDVAVVLFCLGTVAPLVGVPLFGLYLAFGDWSRWRERVNTAEEEML